MKTTGSVFSFGLKITLIGVAMAAASQASFAAIPLYTLPINLLSPACIGLGDIVSCSAPALNVLNGFSANTAQPGGYVLDTPQGALKDYIVVNAGGVAALDNQDATPINGAVDNGFKANVGGDDYFKMGDNVFEGTNGGTPLGDTAGTWDVSLAWLRDALTVAGKRHDLMIGFDFNQPQNGIGSLDIWSLITVRDVDAQGNTTRQINYELNQQIGNPLGFLSTKTFGTGPASSDFVRVTNSLCVKPNGGLDPAAVKPVNADGSCPLGYTAVDNAQSTSSTEFINFIPELNDRLGQLIIDGYDTLSVSVWMGCFGTKDNKGDANSPVLTDGGMTTGCDAGGYGDIFLLAGAVTETKVPEPGSMMLLGAALAGLGWSRRKRA